MAPNPTTAYPTGRMSALAVGAALPLRADRGVVESAEFCDVFQHKRVRGCPGDARLRFQKSQAACRFRTSLEVFDIGLADLLLLGQALELRPQHRRLKFSQPVVEADHTVLKLVGDARAP